jgi:hypothetical protein
MRAAQWSFIMASVFSRSWSCTDLTDVYLCKFMVQSTSWEANSPWAGLYFFLSFAECQSLLLCSQEFTTQRYSDTDQFMPIFTPLFKIDFLILFSHLSLNHPRGLFPSDSSFEFFMHFLYFLHLPYASSPTLILKTKNFLSKFPDHILWYTSFHTFFLLKTIVMWKVCISFTISVVLVYYTLDNYL